VRNLLEATGADSIGRFFVFLNLLKCQAKRVAEFFLAHPEHHPAHANPASDMLVGRVWRLFCQRSYGLLPLLRSALGHVWTAPWQELSDVAAALVGCGHVSGLFVRR